MPFKSKSKVKELKGDVVGDDKHLLKKLNLPYEKPLKNYLLDKEKDVYAMIQRLQAIRNLKDKKAKITRNELDLKEKQAEEKKIKLQKKRNRERTLKKSSSKGKGKKA